MIAQRVRGRTGSSSFWLVFRVHFVEPHWVVQIQGAPRVVSRHANKHDAVLLAKSLAKDVSAVLVDEGPTSPP